MNEVRRLTSVRSDSNAELTCAQGYVVSTIKHKLKPELASTATSDIRELRLSGQVGCRSSVTLLSAGGLGLLQVFVDQLQSVRCLRACCC